MLAAVSRQRPDRVPKDLSWGLTPPVRRLFREKTGRDDPDDYFGIDIRFLGLGLPPELQRGETQRRREAFSPYHAHLPEGATLSEWGTAHLPGTFHHFQRYVPSMRSFTALAQFEAYPYPDLAAPERVPPAAAAIRRFHERGLAVGGALATTIFEVAWQMRGMEELFLDFALRPELAAYLLNRITAIRCDQARLLAEAGVDILVLGDDVSMQTGMLMSPATWRRWFKGRLASVIAAAQAVNPGLPIFYHSDGNPEAIIPELIEIGVTILNPVQPECMDPALVKERYGDRLAIWGTIGTQTTMPFGTPEEVRAEVKHRIDTVGRDGGLVLGPTHSLEPDVPWENIVALYEAIEEYGEYK